MGEHIVDDVIGELAVQGLWSRGRRDVDVGDPTR